MTEREPLISKEVGDGLLGGLNGAADVESAEHIYESSLRVAFRCISTLPSLSPPSGIGISSYVVDHQDRVGVPQGTRGSPVPDFCWWLFWFEKESGRRTCSAC